MTDTDLLTSLTADLKEHTPDLEILYKDESKFMRLLGFLMGPINPTFMTMFVTTIGTKVYFPSREYVAAHPIESTAVMAHEFVHMLDESKEGALKYKHAYLAPQVYFVPALLVYSIFVNFIPGLVFLAGYAASCLAARANKYVGWAALATTIGSAFLSAWLFSGWAALGLLGATLLPLAPLPSPGRTRLELRGYAMSIAVYRWLTGKDYSTGGLNRMRSFFNGPAYYFMSWSPSKIADSLADAEYATRSGKIAKEMPYSVVYTSLKKHGRLVD